MGGARHSNKKNDTANRAKPIKQRPNPSAALPHSYAARWVPRDRRQGSGYDPAALHPSYGCTSRGSRMGAARQSIKKNDTANRAKPIKQRHNSSAALPHSNHCKMGSARSAPGVLGTTFPRCTHPTVAPAVAGRTGAARQINKKNNTAHRAKPIKQRHNSSAARCTVARRIAARVVAHARRTAHAGVHEGADKAHAARRPRIQAGRLQIGMATAAKGIRLQPVSHGEQHMLHRPPGCPYCVAVKPA